METVTRNEVAEATRLVIEGAMRLDMGMEELCGRVEEVGGIAGLLALLLAREEGKTGGETLALAIKVEEQRWLRTIARPLRYKARVEVARDRQITLERFVPSIWHGIPAATEKLADLNEAARELLVTLTWEGA